MEERTETAERHPVRRRHNTRGSVLRPRKIERRATERVSGEMASIQGLIHRFGRRETIAELFESVMLPALREYVKPYAEKAREERANETVR